MNRRKFVAGTAAAAAAVAVGGLSSPSVRAQGAARVLKFAPHADLAVVDPIYTTAFVTRNHAAMVFDTLYGVDDNLQPQPQMVAGHTIENDGKTWNLTLREGLLFHDGEPVLARDAIASIKRWGSRDAYAISFLQRIDEMTAVSDNVVRIRLNRPFPMLPHVLGKPGSSLAAIMPERLANTPGTEQITEVVGSGPYRFVASERIPGALNVYEKFAGYVPRSEGATSFLAGPKIVHFDRVEWHTLPDASTAAAALQAGEIDWWEFPVVDLLPVLEVNEDVVIEVQDPAGMPCVLRFNHLQPPFDNPAIRRAIVGAIKQQDFMMATGGENPDRWDIDVGFFHPKSPMASQVAMEGLTGPRDLEAVKAQLQQAGYSGQRVVLLNSSDHPIINPLNQVCADVLQKIGLNVEIRTSDWGSTFQQLLSPEPLDNGGWSVHCNYTSGLGTMNPAAHTYMRGSGRKALFGWPDIPRLEELRDAWLDAPTEEAQKEICAEMQAVGMETIPYIPLGVYYQPTAYRRNLEGMLKGIPLFYNIHRT